MQSNSRAGTTYSKVCKQGGNGVYVYRTNRIYQDQVSIEPVFFKLTRQYKQYHIYPTFRSKILPQRHCLFPW